MTLKDTAALVPILGLDHVLTSLAPSDYKMDKLITSFPDFFRNVSDILGGTTKETIQAFLSWKVIQNTASYVQAPEVKPYTQFINKLSGKVSSLPVSDECSKSSCRFQVFLTTKHSVGP
jgi:endothelin-converting enzyme